MKKKTKTKKSHYEVRVIAYATVLVIAAESPEKALEYATDAVSSGDLVIDEASIARVVPEDGLDQARVMADVVADE